MENDELPNKIVIDGIIGESPNSEPPNSNLKPLGRVAVIQLIITIHAENHSVANMIAKPLEAMALKTPEDMASVEVIEKKGFGVLYGEEE